MKVDQCLFGYEDGHRLLASSMPLGEEASSLTELSDLAPGAVFGRSGGYWTGMPAPRIGRYALMRTWPAPEMPRPGCVWTHALLLAPSLLEELHDLSILGRLVTRPQKPSDRARYRFRLDVKPNIPVGMRRPSPADDGVIVDLIVALYGATAGTGATAGIVEIAAPGDADDAIFDLWSQQWPRLRRNFRFQTSVAREVRSSSSARVDATLVLAARNRPTEPKINPAWVDRTVADLDPAFDRTLRSHLWRYGQDVRRQRGSFRPLVEIKLIHDAGRPDAGPALLELIAAAFPETEDALGLKQDVVDGILVPQAQASALKCVLDGNGATTLPPPTEAGVARLAMLWPESPLELLELAERTADARNPLERWIFRSIAGAIPMQEFWKLTVAYPRIRERMVIARPELLASADVLALDDDTLASLLRVVPAEASVGADLVPRLVSRDDARLAELAIDKFPRMVASRVIAAADARAISKRGTWVQTLVRRPMLLLDPAVMAQISRTSLVLDLAEALGWLSPAVRAAGTAPWVAAVSAAEDDIPADRRDVLDAFLVALALASGGGEGRVILEMHFDGVHEGMMRGRLPWQANDILGTILPDIGWTRAWDHALRLRIGVALAYVGNGYPTESFARLAKGRKTRLLLAEAAEFVEGGGPFARAATG